MDILVVTSPPAGEPLRLPVPAGELAVRGMVELSGETKAGTYYPKVKVPKDLDGFRAQMLAFSNAGRRDPDSRKTHRTATVTDLSLNEVITKGGAKEKVFRENDTPPYFSDQKSDPARPRCSGWGNAPRSSAPRATSSKARPGRPGSVPCRSAG
jgi:hypothetical protein